MITLPMTGILLAAVLLLVVWAESAPTTTDAPTTCADDKVMTP